MWWRSILFGCTYGIALHTTLPVIYYDLPKGSRTVLMASIDHEARRTRDVFLALLTNNDYPLLEDYEESGLTNWQHVFLFQHYFDKPSLHKFVFPFKILCENPHLTALIKPRLSEYKPGVVKFQLDRHPVFTDEDRVTILRSIGDQITLYGDASVIAYAWKGGIGDFSHDALEMVEMARGYTFFPKSDYELVLEALEDQRAEIGNFRYAAWRTQLLCLMVGCPTSSSAQKKVLIEEYLRSVEIDHVPPFFILELVKDIVACGLEFNAGIFPPVDASILKIHKTLPGTPGLGGSLATCNKQWIRYLHVKGGYRLQIPGRRLDHVQLLEWWAHYAHLGRVLLFRQKFDAPLSFLDYREDPKVCRDIICLLDELALILATTTSIVQATVPGFVLTREVEVSETTIKAYARTLASNILYREQVGNLPVSDGFYYCLSDINFCTTLALVALRHLLSNQADLVSFISPNLIQATTPFPSTISLLRPLDAPLSVVNGPRYLISSVILFLIEFLMTYLDTGTELGPEPTLLIIYLGCYFMNFALHDTDF